MAAPLVTVVRLMLVLALAFNGWAAPVHAHSAVTSAAVSTGQVDGGADCHDTVAEPAGTSNTATEDCCAGGDCQVCNCVMTCASTLPAATATGSNWGPSIVPGAGPADAPGAGCSGNPLRPPIA